jgi:hypothetical protein
MDIIIDYYKNKCTKSVQNNVNVDDNEMNHINQDKLYRKFITDIVDGKIKNMKTVKTIALLLKRDVVKYDKNRWYS